MCDHYDSYYRMTPAEEKEHEAAQKREAERVAYEKEKRIRAFGRKFGYKYEAAVQLIEEWEFLNNWR